MIQPHVQRVLDERDDLARKCDALLVFLGGEIFLSLPRDKRDLLNEQYAVMRDYLDILGKRLSLESTE